MKSRFLLAILLAAVALPAHAQTVQGRAVDRETLQPIADASLALLDVAGAAVATTRSGPDGAFRITALEPGEYRLTASRLGYRTMLSAAVTLGEGEVVDVEARISPQAVALDTATVVGEVAAGVNGRVLEEGADRPVPGARVTLINSRGLAAARAVTDEEGRFHLRVRDPGAYRMRTERVGYQRTQSPAVTVDPGDTVQVELRISTETVVLAPLTVIGSPRRLLRDADMAAFEWRRAHNPWGRFLGPDRIRRLNPFHTSDILQHVPFVTVSGGLRRHVLLGRGTATITGGGGACFPNVYLDGRPLRVSADFTLDEMVIGSTVEAVEVYASPVSAPGEFPARDNPYCGVIVLWTRAPGEAR
jgi:hypothetical protein